MGDLYATLIKTFSLEPLDPPMIAVMAVLFFVFWKLLMERQVFGPQLEILNDRISATEGLRGRAAATMREAAVLVEKYDARLSEVRAEAFGFKNAELGVARKEVSDIVAGAEAEAEKILAAAKAETIAFVAQARNAAKAEADGLARTMATTVTASLQAN